METPEARLSPRLGAVTGRRHCGEGPRRTPTVCAPALGAPPPPCTHSSGTVTRPRGGPPWLQLSPAQLPGPHPGSPVRPPVLRASCPRSPSPGLPPARQALLSAASMAPATPSPTDISPHGCQASRIMGVGVGHLALQEAGGAQPSAEPVAPAPAPRDPHLVRLPVPAWTGSGLSRPFEKTSQGVSAQRVQEGHSFTYSFIRRACTTCSCAPGLGGGRDPGPPGAVTCRGDIQESGRQK